MAEESDAVSDHSFRGEQNAEKKPFHNDRYYALYRIIFPEKYLHGYAIVLVFAMVSARVF